MNAGNNAANGTLYDLDGHPRKVGVIDLGAYEFQVNLSQPCTWTGNGGDDSWSNPANWSDGTVPTPCRDVLIPSGHTVIVPTGTEGLGKTLEVETGAELVTDPAAEMNIGN